MSFVRLTLVKLSAVVAAMLLLTGCTAGATDSAPATGETTEVTVTVSGMVYTPDVIEVPAGNELIVTFENTGTVVHDLVFDNGARSADLTPGQSEVIDVGVISGDLDAWCAISNHRALGMELTVKAIK